ncbi:MAG: cytochrome c biogenesis protein CcdA [Acidimicrobiales bacterium]
MPGLLAVSLPSALAPGMVIAFLAGALSFLSPCVLPLVPSYLSLMSGVGASELAVATKVDQRRLLRSTLLFVAGYSAVFTALGALASTVGGFLFDHKLGLQKVSGVLIVVMGLAIAGLVRPAVFDRERRFHVSPSALGSYAPPVMGAAFAFGWSPCIGPVLGAILGLAAQSASLGRGVLLLLAYSAGLGVPFVASGVAFGRLTGAFSWVKRHFGVINLVSGLLLAGFGLLLLTGSVTDVVRWLQDVMRALGLDTLANSL